MHNVPAASAAHSSTHRLRPAIQPRNTAQNDQAAATEMAKRWDVCTFQAER